MSGRPGRDLVGASRGQMSLKFKALSNPILVVGDNPSLPGGLSRSGCDLAALLQTLPEFRVGYLARGDGNRRAFPWAMYPHSASSWGESAIEAAWQDFAGAEDGLILTTDDPSRRLWFSDPGAFPRGLEKFLGEGRRFRKLGYFPVDSTGVAVVSAGLSTEGRATVAGYDRVLATSEWGRDVLRADRADVDWLPHGLHLDKFYPTPDAREILGWADKIVVGCVMANQSRKDFPVAFHAARLLQDEYGSRFRFWLHTDVMVRYWNVYALAADYGLHSLLCTEPMEDRALALHYSGAACTILPSAGEGFGFPIAESLACGTGAIVTDYAAGQEIVQSEHRVLPVGFRIDTQYNVKRAVLSGHGFARLAEEEIERKLEDWDFRADELADSVAHLDWKRLRYPWEKWFRGCLR